MKTFIVRTTQGTYRVKAAFVEITPDRMLAFYEKAGGDIVTAIMPGVWFGYAEEGTVDGFDAKETT